MQKELIKKRAGKDCNLEQTFSEMETVRMKKHSERYQKEELAERYQRKQVAQHQKKLLEERNQTKLLKVRGKKKLTSDQNQQLAGIYDRISKFPEQIAPESDETKRDKAEKDTCLGTVSPDTLDKTSRKGSNVSMFLPVRKTPLHQNKMDDDACTSEPINVAPISPRPDRWSSSVGRPDRWDPSSVCKELSSMAFDKERSSSSVRRPSTSFDKERSSSSVGRPSTSFAEQSSASIRRWKSSLESKLSIVSAFASRVSSKTSLMSVHSHRISVAAFPQERMEQFIGLPGISAQKLDPYSIFVLGPWVHELRNQKWYPIDKVSK
jgi:hypothetical protein